MSLAVQRVQGPLNTFGANCAAPVLDCRSESSTGVPETRPAREYRWSSRVAGWHPCRWDRRRCGLMRADVMIRPRWAGPMRGRPRRLRDAGLHGPRRSHPTVGGPGRQRPDRAAARVGATRGLRDRTTPEPGSSQPVAASGACFQRPPGRLRGGHPNWELIEAPPERPGSVGRLEGHPSPGRAPTTAARWRPTTSRTGPEICGPNCDLERRRMVVLGTAGPEPRHGRAADTPGRRPFKPGGAQGAHRWRMSSTTVTAAAPSSPPASTSSP